MEQQGRNNSDNSTREEKRSTKVLKYKILKDRPLTDYIMRNRRQHEQEENDENRLAAWSSFDVERYCHLGGTVRIGVNGRVRQPSQEASSEYDYWEEMERLTCDKYNQMLWDINENNGTLDVKKKTEVYSWTSHVPLCWEDQLSDSTLTHSSRQENYEHCGNEDRGKPEDCLENQYESDFADAVSSIQADISCIQTKFLSITLQSHLGSQLKPALDAWSFDVLVVDKTDSRQSTRVFSSVKPQLHNNMNMYTVEFDILRDLQWIHSISQLHGREFHVTVMVTYPCRSRLCSQLVQVANASISADDMNVDENKSMHSEEDDEDAIPVSSLPTIVLSEFDVRNEIEVETETETETFPIDARGKVACLQQDSPTASGHKMRSLVCDKEQAKDPRSEMLMTGDMVRIIKERTYMGSPLLLVARSTKSTRYGKNRSSRSSPTESTTSIFAMQRTTKHPLDANESGPVPKFVERQRKSFLRAQHVFKNPKLTSRIKTQTDRPPDVRKARQLIEPVGDNIKSKLNVPHVPSCLEAKEDKHALHSSTQIPHSLSHSMARCPRRTHRDLTTLRAKSAPSLPTQDVVSLTGLRPTTTYRTCRFETTATSKSDTLKLHDKLLCSSSYLYNPSCRSQTNVTAGKRTTTRHH